MASKAHSDGIKQLLLAEQQASQKVNEARKRKVKRLKQAKDEALSEIQKYKDEKDQEFKQNEDLIFGSKQEIESQIAESTERDLTDLDCAVKGNMEAALEKILDLVYDIQGVVHVNFHPIKEDEQKSAA